MKDLERRLCDLEARANGRDQQLRVVLVGDDETAEQAEERGRRNYGQGVTLLLVDFVDAVDGQPCAV